MKYSLDWWTDQEGGYIASYYKLAQSLHEHVNRCAKRRACVQAGGHVGIYPIILSQYFERVYTFEPDAQNFRSLVINYDEITNIYATRALLGEEHGGRELLLGKSTGGHNIGGAGPVPTFRIDDLALEDCDAIFLDVEGFEIPALHGAKKTIMRSHPLIVAEENKKLHGKGFEFGDLGRMLAMFGYVERARVLEDVVFQ